MTDETTDGLKFDTNVIGSTGLRQFGGYIQEEILKELRGQLGARIYREMADNDPTVGGMLFAITTLIRQVEWTVQASDDSPEAEAAKCFVEEVIADMSVPWASVITEICSMFVYGFAPMEILWKRRGGNEGIDPNRKSAYSDNKIGLRALALRSQNTIPKWLIDPEDGSIDGMYQQPWNGGMVLIPEQKLLLFRTTEERGNPEGRSLLRNCYRPWYFKKRLEELEAIGAERDLAGLPIAYIPGQYLAQGADNIDKAAAAEFKRLITSIKRDTHEGIVLPSTRDANGNLLFDIKLLSSAGSRQHDTSKIIDRYDKRIATTVLADFLFLGQGSTGSFALSSDKTSVFATAIGAFTKSIADVLNRHLLPRLWRLNGLDVETMPMMVPGDLEKPDLGVLAEFVTKMASAGATMFPDRELENALRSAAGLPLAPEEGEDDMMEAEDPMNPPTPSAEAAEADTEDA